MDYEIAADGKALPWQTETGEPAPLEHGPGIIPKWKKSVIPFAAGQTREVIIRYRAAYCMEYVASWGMYDTGGMLQHP